MICLYNLSGALQKWKTCLSHSPVTSEYTELGTEKWAEMSKQTQNELDRHWQRTKAWRKYSLFKVVRKQVSRLFPFLCRPSSSNHFIWLKMLMKVDETELNAKWWKSKNKTERGGSNGKGKKSRPWANEQYYYTKGDMPQAHWRTYVTG